MLDWKLIDHTYRVFARRVEKARQALGRPLTLAEKILYAHLYDKEAVKPYRRGEDYVHFAPDRVAMQDATAQMALLQFMNVGRQRTAVPTSVHCDHIVVAEKGAELDLQKALVENKEVYDFLRSVADKYGIDFWKPSAGIIHQVVLENYAFPGGLMIGTDSHTPTAGGLGMLGIGVGGADAMEVMAGMSWELKMPKIIGVKLTGWLNNWTAPKDVILKLTGMLTVKGGTNAIIEYFGEGCESISATGKATICNMGAEVGATSSVFPYDINMGAYLSTTGREKVAARADLHANELRADDEVEKTPEKYYDSVIEIDLSTLEPYINGPFTPDAAWPLSQFAQVVKEKGYPRWMEVGLLGSCTNSSYEDLSQAADLAQQVLTKALDVNAELIINPGSQLVLEMAQKDGLLDDLIAIGGVVMANACGPCIGQWNRRTDNPTRPNSLVMTFNRNFAKRTDGNPNSHVFIASPALTIAFTIAGDLCFNPLKDKLINRKGQEVMLDAPVVDALPLRVMRVSDNGYVAPVADGADISVVVRPDSQRLQLLQPFKAWDGRDFEKMPLLIKTQGKTTTDHISMAGPWLKYRGHLENISDNLLMGATNAFNGETNKVLNQLDGSYDAVSTVAKAYKAQGIDSIIVGAENYGEGSSREHAALEPRFLGVKVVLVKSFARIHETNLKKQGMLALTFAEKNDYDRIREADRISITGLAGFASGLPVTVTLHHADGSTETFDATHTYNAQQIKWFRAGSAFNQK